MFTAKWIVVKGNSKRKRQLTHFLIPDFCVKYCRLVWNQRNWQLNSQRYHSFLTLSLFRLLKGTFLFVISYVYYLGATFGQGTSWKQTRWKSQGTSNLQWKESAGARLGRNCDPYSSSFAVRWCSIFGSAPLCSPDWSFDYEGWYTKICYPEKMWNVLSIGENDNHND